MAAAVTEATFDAGGPRRARSPCSSTSGPSGAARATPSRRCSTRSPRSAEDLKLVKVNIDEEQGLAMRYGVQSIPTMVLFKDGEPAAAASARSRRARSSARSASSRRRSSVRGRRFAVARGTHPAAAGSR